MNDKIKDVFSRLKNGKVIVILGIVGIALIFLSSFFTGDTKKKNEEDVFDKQAYGEQLQQDVEKIVKEITGCKNVTVMITLESGITYDYADDSKINKSDRLSGDTTDTQTDSENKYIIITDASGNQKPLVVSEQLPRIRGVAVIYDGYYNESINAQIKEVIMATLDITSKRIYIGATKY